MNCTNMFGRIGAPRKSSNMETETKNTARNIKYKFTINNYRGAICIEIKTEV